jgi:aspartyl protease family protein
MRLQILPLSAALLLAGPSLAQEIHVHGLSEDKAVVSLDGGKPRVLRAGDRLAEGIKLVKVDGTSALFLINGEKQVLSIGQNIAAVSTQSGNARTTLTADSTGHFFSNGSINGGTIKFLVDTGATHVFLSASDARRLGINYLKGEVGYSGTAGGTVRVYRVKLDSVKLGDLCATNIDAVVSEKDAVPFALLGMSFLNRMQMTRDGDQLTLTQRY